MVFKERTKDSMLLEGHISCLQARYEVRNQNQLINVKNITFLRRVCDKMRGQGASTSFSEGHLELWYQLVCFIGMNFTTPSHVLSITPFLTTFLRVKIMWCHSIQIAL